MKLNRYEQNLIFWQLLLYGVHIGHRFRNSSLYAGWLVFTYTYKTLIINLYKTILGFKNGNVGYDYCTRSGSPIWFLNLNKAYDIYTNESALKCGEFAYSTYWIHGMISNWLFLADQINQLWHYTEDAHKGQFKKLEMDYSPWFLSRWSWPRSVLISSVHTSEWPSHECLVSRTPSVGIVDTNIPGHISNIATPGNDDSLDSIVYYNTNSSQYILEKKYGNITGWLHRVRSHRRNITFSEWVLRYYIDKKKLGLKLHKSKLITNIRNREKKNKMTDYLYNVVRFNINVTNFWGLGVKFFFSLGSGGSKFQGSLDLYSPKGGDDDKWKTYGLMEKFKKRGFFICKILNYYLLKRVWLRNSSFVVRKKYMSDKWFKFRFLTCAYYKKEWFDDYYKTNFLTNRFWRNRIFKTFFRWSGFRKSRFAMKFFKFYNVYRYNKKRGFLDWFSSSYLNSSSFAKVAFSAGFGYFKKHFYYPLINKDNNIKYLNIIKKKSDMGKWLFFKRAIFQELSKILNSSKMAINKYMRYSFFYRVYSMLKPKLKKFIYIIYCYINFYFSFRFHNKLEYRILKKTRKSKLVKLFRALKNLCKFPKLVEFYNKSAAPYQRFQFFFLKNFIKVGTYELFNTDVSKIFSMLSFNYRKRYYAYYLKHRYKKVKGLKKYFKKLKRSHGYARYRNWVIDTLDFKYDKFKDTEEVRRIVKNLHKKFRTNYPAKHYSDSYNIKINNKSSFRQVFNIAKSRDKWALRLLNFNALKLNIRNFNFYQVSKAFYGKKILKDWNRATSSIVNEDKWLIEDKNDTETPSLFFQLMSKSKNPTNNMISSHNLPYFNKVIMDSTFYNILRKINDIINLKSLRKVKIISKNKNKKLIREFLAKDKKFRRFVYKKIRSIKILKREYRSNIRRAGNTKTYYLTGSNRFNNLKFIKFWQIVKKHFFVERGFDVKIWELNFNKTLTKRYSGLYKSSYLNNLNVLNYAYFFFFRFINIYSKQLSLFRNRMFITFSNFTTIKKDRCTIYVNEIRKVYWN